MGSRDLRIRALPLLVAAALCGVAPGPARAAPARELRLGLLPEVNIFKQKARFRGLGEYLAKHAAVPVRFTILSRYGNVVDRFRSDGVDGAFFGSFTGALSVERLGAIPIARPVNLDGTSTYHGHVFVRKDAGVRGIADLRGRRMAFVDRATTAGYVFPLAWLRESGIARPEQFFGESFFTGSHDAAIHAVLDGDADVGAAKDTVWDRMAAEDPRVLGELAILAESPPVPSNALCVRADLDPELRARVTVALLRMHEDPAGQQVLKELGARRFVSTSAADYRPVLEMARKAGIELSSYGNTGE